ncbi:MAG: hypothetical protein IJK28_11130 [Clostridia bacterium]|nr:hypothetical protein [Clostridia bacterium]
MSAKIREALLSAAITLLLSVGLILPLSAMLGLLSEPVTVTGCFGALIISLIAGFLFQLPKGTMVGFVTFSLVTAGWLIFGGFRLAADMASMIRLAGYGISIPLNTSYGRLILPLACLITFVSAGIVNGRSAFAALCAVLGLLIALWLTKHESHLRLLIPSCAAALVLWSGEHSEASVSWKNLILMLTTAFLCVLIVPLHGVTVDPLKNAADTIRQSILDRYFFIDPRNIFSLSHEYNLSQLGGKPYLSDNLVMTVETPRVVYLRGAILDTYTGRAWRDTTAGSRYLWDGLRWRNERKRIFDEALPAVSSARDNEIEIRVTMKGKHTSTLFVPQRIRGIRTEGNLIVYFNEASEVFTTRDLTAGDTYRVTAVTDTHATPGMAQILDECSRYGDPDRDLEIREAYLSLPANLPDLDALNRIAGEAVSGANTRFEMASRIARWLATHCRYTLDVPEPNPYQDFVSSFVLQTHEGYCTYFASAMVVLCRLRGIPARYVEGYTASPGPDGIAQVTGKNCHAWVEVWFSGYGWLTFDPTPPDFSAQPEQSRGSQQQPQATPAPTPLPTPTPTPPPDDPMPDEDETQSGVTPPPTEPPQDDNAQDDLPLPPETQTDTPRSESGGASLRWLWLLLIPVLLALLVIFCISRIRRRMPAFLSDRVESEDERWRIWLRALCDVLCVQGLNRPADWTYAEWLTSLSGRLGCEALRSIGETANLVFYAHAEPMQSETGEVTDAFRILYGRLSRRQKLRWLLRRGRQKPIALSSPQ